MWKSAQDGDCGARYVYSFLAACATTLAFLCGCSDVVGDTNWDVGEADTFDAASGRNAAPPCLSPPQLDTDPEGRCSQPAVEVCSRDRLFACTQASNDSDEYSWSVTNADCCDAAYPDLRLYDAELTSSPVTADGSNVELSCAEGRDNELSFSFRVENRGSAKAHVTCALALEETFTFNDDTCFGPTQNTLADTKYQVIENMAGEGGLTTLEPDESIEVSGTLSVGNITNCQGMFGIECRAVSEETPGAFEHSALSEPEPFIQQCSRWMCKEGETVVQDINCDGANVIGFAGFEVFRQ